MTSVLIEANPADSVKNALILYYRPTCPACVLCVPTFKQVPEALASSGFGDVSIYMVNTDTIDVSTAIGGRIKTVPKIVYVGQDGKVFVYPTTDRTVPKIVQFVKNARTNPSLIGGGGFFGSLGNLINDLFTTTTPTPTPTTTLSGGARSRSRTGRRRRRSITRTRSRTNKSSRSRTTKSKSRSRSRRSNLKKKSRSQKRNSQRRNNKLKFSGGATFTGYPPPPPLTLTTTPQTSTSVSGGLGDPQTWTKCDRQAACRYIEKNIPIHAAEEEEGNVSRIREWDILLRSGRSKCAEMQRIEKTPNAFKDAIVKDRYTKDAIVLNTTIMSLVDNYGDEQPDPTCIPGSRI